MIFNNLQKQKITTRRCGFGVVEVVIGVTVISVAYFALVSNFERLVRFSSDTAQDIQATYLAEETAEVLRYLRDADWDLNISTLEANTKYFLTTENGDWETTGKNLFIDDGFERSFKIFDVYRDGSGAIADTGTIDPDIKKVAINIAWLSRGATTSRERYTYLANIF